MTAVNPAFTDISPAESLLHRRGEDFDHAITLFEGRIYLAEISCENKPQDRFRILAYSLESGQWETVHMDMIKESQGLPSPAARSQISAISGPGGDGAGLYARFASPRGAVLLRMDDSGRFHVVPDPDEALERHFALQQLLGWDGQQIGLSSDESGRPAQVQRFVEHEGQWRGEQITGLKDGDNDSVSTLASFDGALYAATVNAESGFELWKLQGDDQGGVTWKMIVDKGAHRFVHNLQVFSMQVHDGALFLAAGAPVEQRVPESKFFSYQGFEVLRLQADGHWDLMIGVPRFSPLGILVPFSGLGPGLDPSRGAEFGCWTSHAGRLVMGIMDKDGFGLWSSQTGENWHPLSDAAFSDIYQVDQCRMFPAGGRLVIVLETTDLDDAHRTQIWAGNPAW